MSVELAVRLGGFGAALAILWLLESWPRTRAREIDARLTRAWRHLGLAALSSVLARLAVPAGLAGVALWSQGAGIGMFNLVPVPGWAVFALTLLVMDLAVWLQHRAMHAVPALWLLHRVHHSDTAMDVTTGLRFHPIEIVISLVWKAAVAVALGAPPEALLAYEVLLNALSLFTHANITLPGWLDRSMRQAFATPAFHLVHHSPRPEETNSNFANALTVWDRLAGTWRDAAALPDPGLGLDEFRARADQTLLALLRQPLRS